MEKIINSMTKKSDKIQKLLKDQGKNRIVVGSGIKIHDVNQLLKIFLMYNG